MSSWANNPTELQATGREMYLQNRSAAIRISCAYLVLGIGWILLSDKALAIIAVNTPDPAPTFQKLEMLKGATFMVVTTLFLYALIRSYIRSMEKEHQAASHSITRIGAEYQLLFERNPLSMWVFDPETLRILAVNEAATRTYGYTRSEFVGLRITDIRLPEEVPGLLRSLEGPPPASQFLPASIHRRKDGSTFHAEVVRHAIEFESRPALLAMAIDVTDRLRAERALEDHRTTLENRVEARTADLVASNNALQAEITRRQRIEAELLTAKAHAESASAAKSIFLANTTHEIRTPLTSILGYADLIVDPDLAPDDRQRYVGVLRHNAVHLLKMIDDLLDLSRIETGKLSVTIDDYAPREIAEQTVELLRPKAAEKGLALALGFEGEIPPAVRTDGVRLRQVLLNLLNNAVKFTPSNGGRISLIVRSPEHADATSAEGHWLQFDVVDPGIGLHKDDLHRIFEPFYQVEQGGNRRFGGTGLGLAISKQLVEQLGGTLEVASEIGHGSVFSLRLPLLLPAAITQHARPAVQSETRVEGHVLLAEDNANIRWLVEEYLRRAGAEVTSVADGAAAVDTIQSAPADPPRFDLVLMDISMPGMDGVEAMGRIRNAGYSGPMVALTAHAASAETGAWTESGWDAVAAKPINRRTFIPLIAKLIEARRQGAASNP